MPSPSLYSEDRKSLRRQRRNRRNNRTISRVPLVNSGAQWTCSRLFGGLVMPTSRMTMPNIREIIRLHGRTLRDQKTARATVSPWGASVCQAMRSTFTMVQTLVLHYPKAYVFLMASPTTLETHNRHSRQRPATGVPRYFNQDRPSRRHMLSCAISKPGQPLKKTTLTNRYTSIKNGITAIKNTRRWEVSSLCSVRLRHFQLSKTTFARPNTKTPAIII